ncbi:glycosyltransferase family 2 protein [Aeromicrobium massiliense]|uniref:glycosyltransferase family 2 protein n=1 Tax=Aeromicrobium massiliense TaxID=1464554 RepID=UPI0002DD3CE1|nr:glycosyltransferase [Aeromicrobium massiliense]
MLESGAFDVSWYAGEAGAAFSTLEDAVAHYLAEGAEAGLAPHPLFDPTTVRKVLDRSTPFGTYLRRRKLWSRSPHPGWDLAFWLRDHPEALDHPYGPLAHLAATLGDDTMLPLVTLEGRRIVRWGDVLPSWTRSSRLWTDISRLRIPALVTSLPDSHVLPDLPPTPRDDSTLVSVVIASWNRAASLRGAIESVQAQTWPHWEAVVVDDGSDDDTAVVVRALAARDERVRLVSRPHEGVSAARNAGIAHARGAYVAFLDSDNVWQPGFLKAMVAVMSDGGLTAAYGTLEQRTAKGSEFRCVASLTREILLRDNHVDLNVLVVRTDLLRTVGGFDEGLRRAVDYDLVLRLSVHTDLVHVPVVGVAYTNDSSAEDRISVREPMAWNDVVHQRHVVDWEAARRVPRVQGRVSVVVTANDRPLTVLRAMRAVASSLRGVDHEIVVVDVSRGREILARTLSLVAGASNVRYLRHQRPVAFATAASVGAAHTTGEHVVLLDGGVVPRPSAVPALIEALEAGADAAQPVVVRGDDSVVVTAGSVFARREAVPAQLLAGHPVGDLEVLESRTPLAALSGSAVALRAAALLELDGLDPLMRDELELADLSLRWRARQPDVGLVLVRDARMHVPVAPRGGEDRHATRRVFRERHAGSVRATPASFWRRWGWEATHWTVDDAPLDPVRPVVHRPERAAGSLRWLLLVGEHPSDWVRAWSAALVDAIEACGDVAVIKPSARVDHSASYLDDVVLALVPEASMPEGQEVVRVRWVHAAPWTVPANASAGDLSIGSTEGGPGGISPEITRPPVSFEGGWVAGTLSGPAPATVTPGAEPVLVVGSVELAPLVVRTLQDAGVPFRVVGETWRAALTRADPKERPPAEVLPWPDGPAEWAELLGSARHVVVLHDHAAVVEGFWSPLVIDALAVRGAVITNLGAETTPWASGVQSFGSYEELVAMLRSDHEPRLDDDARHALLQSRGTSTVVRALRERVLTMLPDQEQD